MANVPITFGGGGVDTSDATATVNDVLSPKTFYGSDGEKHTGTLVSKGDSGNVTLDVSTTSKGYAAGYYPNAHGAAITLEEKTETAGTSAKSVTPTSGKVLSKVTINPTPTQEKSVTPSASSQNVTPDSGKFLSKVTVNGDADLVAGNIKKGVNIFGVAGNWYGNKKTIAAAYGKDTSESTGTESESFTMPADGMVYYGGASIGDYRTSARGICRIYKNGTIMDNRDLDGSFIYRTTMINKSFSANAGDVIKVECGMSAGFGLCCLQAVIVY